MGSNSIMGLTDDYLARKRAYYNAKMSATGTDYSSYSSYSNSKPTTSSIDTGNNTCTDGNDDGKIGLDGIILNLGEGVVKGAINGIKGMFTDSEGKFSLGKTLLSVGIGALCVAFPAVGAVACAVGAVAGGAQIVKGAKVALTADTDAEAKAAWENIGEGGSTVVGCVLGAKASIGAMKGSSTAAVDDVLKSIGNKKDLASVAGKTDDIAKALKSVNLHNADDVLVALKNANIEGLDNVDEVAKAIASADFSALGNLDESLTGMQKVTKTIQAAGKDAVSSSKNNAIKAWKAAMTKAESIKTQRKHAKEANSNYKQAKKDYDEAIKMADDEAIKHADELVEAQKKARNDSDDAWTNYEEQKYGADKQTRKALIDKVNDADTSLDKAIEAVNENKIAKAKANLDDATDALRETSKGKRQLARSEAADEVAAAKTELDRATAKAKEQAKTSELTGKARKDCIETQTKSAQETLAQAKANQKQVNVENSLYGRAKAKVTEVINSNGGEGVTEAHKTTMDALKDLRAGKDGMLKTLKTDPIARNKVLNSLSNEGKIIFNYLFKEGAKVDDAIAKYGWSQVTQVVRTMYACGQTNQVV
ncbi:hypothetical protein IJ425_06310 [bacterium]|nr:hypothetical protein [bacterium]